MPADGELRFLDLFTARFHRTFMEARRHECVRTAFANGLMCCAAAYMGGYLYTHSVSAALNRFGLTGLVVGMLATGFTCSYGKFKEERDK